MTGGFRTGVGQKAPDHPEHGRQPVEPGVDADFFDPYCDHLIVRDEAAGRIVGTYRILPPAAAREVGGYYSETEFDLPVADPGSLHQERGDQLSGAVPGALPGLPGSGHAAGPVLPSAEDPDAGRRRALTLGIGPELPCELCPF